MNLVELVQKVGLYSKKCSSTNGGEYSSPCPECGGKDRFRIWPNQQAKNCVGTYWCRQCGKKGDAIQFCRDFLGMTFQQAIDKVRANIDRPSESTRIERSYSKPIIISPKDKWSHRALGFVLWASKNLLSQSPLLKSLSKRGIPVEAIDHYKIGYCDRNIWVNSHEFGLESEKKLFFPKGIVIPSIEPSGKVVRLKIRRSEWSRSDHLPKYLAVRGSMNGLNIIGSVRNPVMVVVESELDAFAIDWATGNRVFTVAVGSNTKTPDIVVDYWARRRRLLICQDNDAGGVAMKDKWKRLYPHAESISVSPHLGKDIGEAVENGMNLRKWTEEILSPSLLR